MGFSFQKKFAFIVSRGVGRTAAFKSYIYVFIHLAEHRLSPVVTRGGYSLAAVCWLLTEVASFVVELRL